MIKGMLLSHVVAGLQLGKAGGGARGMKDKNHSEIYSEIIFFRKRTIVIFKHLMDMQSSYFHLPLIPFF